MAFVILHSQKAEKWAGRHAEFEKDLKAHARKRLPGFACPEWVVVVPELPVSAAFRYLRVAEGGTLSCGCDEADDGRAENVDREDSEGRASQDDRQALDTFWRANTVLGSLGYSSLY